MALATDRSRLLLERSVADVRGLEKKGLFTKVSVVKHEGGRLLTGCLSQKSGRS